ncbi:RimK/LysX family protein [Candidatus Woesearchaeota archaeon]|nr:RimK/LysX family protein [Candidatus Woesearchaeota archaeon]MCF7901619.1 RimK/LysX family protein [Candidatus Woesearchaeota archaeon]
MNDELQDKTVLGMAEFITVKGNDRRKQIILPARIDTGATRSAIHTEFVKELKLGPVLKARKVKNANGTTVRPVIEVEIIIKNKTLKEEFTVADRSNMKYPILIGRNILKHEFLIDVTKDPTKDPDHKFQKKVIEWLKQQ